MRYRVLLWRTSASRKADVEQVVPRVLDVDDAIRSLMQKLDLGYANTALAYAIDRDTSEVCPDNWKRQVRCHVSGKFSCIKDDTWQGPLPD